jgi:glycosyltransferase involved in cell wall biosynthesis
VDKVLSKILIVSYYFYPCSLIGAKRISYITNYLANKDIDVTILKADNVYYDSYIDSSLKLDSRVEVLDVKNIKLYKNIFQPIYLFFKFKKHLDRLLRNDKYDLLYFSGGPFFYFPLGAVSKFKFKIPYILDFRDLWIAGKFVKLNWKGKLIRKMENIFEKYSASHSNAIISVSPNIAKLYKQYLTVKSPSKVFMVLNGYNNEELPSSNEKVRIEHDLIRIGIFGKFSTYELDHVDILIKTMKQWKEVQRIEIHHVGLIEQEFIKLIGNHNLNQNFIFTGYKNYYQGIVYMQKMDFLILNNRSTYGIGSKTFDYLYLNKPILAFLDPKYENWDFLSQFKSMYLIQKPLDLVDAIKDLLKKEDWTVIDRADLKQYSRKYQTDKLYKYLIDSGLLRESS